MIRIVPVDSPCLGKLGRKDKLKISQPASIVWGSSSMDSVLRDVINFFKVPFEFWRWESRFQLIFVSLKTLAFVGLQQQILRKFCDFVQRWTAKAGANFSTFRTRQIAYKFCSWFLRKIMSMKLKRYFLKPKCRWNPFIPWQRRSLWIRFWKSFDLFWCDWSCHSNASLWFFLQFLWKNKAIFVKHIQWY